MEKKLTAEEITEYRTKEIQSIPPTGLKYFQQTGSLEEAAEIECYLQATKELISHKKVRKLGSLSQGIWHPEIQKAEVTHQVGSYWSTIGHVADAKLYLFPEEALYLLERGVLEISYNGVNMSVQRAYSTLLKPYTDLTIECYRVYSELNANGFKVFHHVKSNIFTKYEKQLEMHKAKLKIRKSRGNLKRNPNDTSTCKNFKVKKLKMSNLMEIFPIAFDGQNEDKHLEKLRIFNPYEDDIESTLAVNYDVYLTVDEKNSFKKTCLQLPRFRVVVHRGSDEMPEWEEFYRLGRSFEDEVPIVHAIVFPECISFYRIDRVATPLCD